MTTDQEITQKARNLLEEMPIGNAKIYCQNRIFSNENNRALQTYWGSVKEKLSEIK